MFIFCKCVERRVHEEGTTLRGRNLLLFYSKSLIHTVHTAVCTILSLCSSVLTGNNGRAREQQSIKPSIKVHKEQQMLFRGLTRLLFSCRFKQQPRHHLQLVSLLCSSERLIYYIFSIFPLSFGLWRNSSRSIL